MTTDDEGAKSSVTETTVTESSSLKRTSDHLESKEDTGHKISHQNDQDLDRSDQPGPSGVVKDDEVDQINFTVVFMKEKYDLILPTNNTVAQLKDILENKVGVPAATQKLLYKGLARPDMTLTEWGLKSGSKVILMGSRVKDIIDVQPPVGNEDSKEEGKTDAVSGPEPLSKQKPHAKVIEKGVPPDVMPALKNVKAPLPPEPLSGMVNKSGGKVRLTFKLEVDQLWIGTKERTEKVSMSSVRAVVSEPIHGHEEYHMLAIQLGPTEASRYWIYWVPSQYVHAIKRTILND